MEPAVKGGRVPASDAISGAPWQCRLPRWGARVLSHVSGVLMGSSECTDVCWGQSSTWPEWRMAPSHGLCVSV